jgi:hypothetical protein
MERVAIKGLGRIGRATRKPLAGLDGTRIAAMPRRGSSYMPIDSGFDARCIPLRIGPAGAQTADMRRLPLAAVVCRQRRPAAVGSTLARLW